MERGIKVLSILAENNPAVLARISSLFGRRGYNIDSLTVSDTHNELKSRITITLECSEEEVVQILNQTKKLEEIKDVELLDQSSTVMREIVLIKVKADTGNRGEIREIAKIYKASIVDLSPNSMIIELTGKTAKIDGFIKIMKDYEIVEICRTGITAMKR